MKKIPVLICLLISYYAFSQTSDTLLKKYDQQFIYRYGSSYMKGGNKLSFAELKTEFSKSSPSFDLYKKSRKDKTISIVLSFASTVMIFGVLSAVHRNNSNSAYTFIGAQLLIGVGSITLNRKSITETDRAIQIRNRELLFPNSSSSLSVQ